MENRNHNVLNTDRIGPLLLKLTIPAFFGMFVQALYNVVSTIFVGQFIGSPEEGGLAIGGLTIVFPLQMLAMGFGMMVGIGGASLISRQLGAGKNDDAERTLGNGFTISLILSIIVAIVVLPFMDFWLRLIGASDAILVHAKDYLVFIISGSFFAIFSMALLSFARAEGNARVGMTAMILGAGFSIAFSALFIIVFDMGTKGAGLATIIAQFISVIYFMFYYFGGKSYLKIRLKNLMIDWKILRDIMVIGISAFAMMEEDYKIRISSADEPSVWDDSENFVVTHYYSFLSKWGIQGSAEGQFVSPYGIAVAGYVYVADSANNRIQRFTTDGIYVSKWGNGGTGDGQFQTPTGIDVDSAGNVYVVDSNNNRIQKFTSDGSFVTK